MAGRKKNSKREIHITILEETAEELEALMKHERETYPSRVIDRAIHARYSKLPQSIKDNLRTTV